MKGLQGKTAIVTGGATMIGAAVVEVLRQAGVRVAVFDIDAEGAARAVARDPATTRFWPIDITDDRQLQQGVADVAAQFGGVDYLVNLACTYTDGGATAAKSRSKVLPVSSNTMARNTVLCTSSISRNANWTKNG